MVKDMNFPSDEDQLPPKTNDEQAKYGMEEQRAPLLSDEDLDSITVHDGGLAWESAKEVRDFYEAKITSGELRELKTASRVPTEKRSEGECSNCGGSVWPEYKCCPRCTATLLK